VLAGGKRGAGAIGTAAGRGGVKIDVDRRVGEARVAVGAPLEPAALLGQCRELFRIAPEQCRLGYQPVAVRESEAALGADRQQ
jgi:hypothetical protein